MDKGSAKERLIIKLVCVLLSFCLWIYVNNVETTVKTYTLKNVPVKLVNVEALKNYGLALSPGQKFEVNLNLEGPSKYIYSVNQNDFTIQADLSEYALKNGENNIPVQIINYPQQVNIKNNGYLIVKVKLEPLEQKTFDTVSDVNVTFAPNVYKDSINFTSEKVEVSGPQSAVNKVKTVALVGSLDNVSESMVRSFKYEALDANNNVVKDVTLSKSSGELSVLTNTGKKVNVVAEFKGQLPNGITLLSTEISQNSVNIVGDKSALEGVSTLKTEPIDLTNITGNTKKTVQIVLPSGVKVAGGNNTVTVNINVSGNTSDVDKNTQENNNNNNNNNNNTNNNSNNANNNNSNNNNTTNNSSNNNVVKSLDIPISYTGLPQNLILKNNPSTATIKITGSQDLINSISPSDFKGVVDLSSYTNPGSYKVEPKITTSKNVVIESIPDLSITLDKKDAEKKQ